MNKGNIKNQKTNQDAGDSLLDIATELRALAYLFETQGIKANQISEMDMDLIGHGIGRILRRLTRQMRRIAQNLDKKK